jgi:hypothetical protein
VVLLSQGSHDTLVALNSGLQKDKADLKGSDKCYNIASGFLSYPVPTCFLNVRCRVSKMDPLSILASVVGLLTAAGTVSSILNTIILKINDAPRLMGQVLSEVNDVEISLSAIHKFLLGMASAPKQRIALIQLNHLIAILTESVFTFSELEALVTPFAARSQILIMVRVKWAWKEDTVLGIMQRLQRHKSSLSLMLNIVQW